MGPGAEQQGPAPRGGAMNPIHIMHLVPRPVRGLLVLAAGMGFVVLILVVAVTRLPAAMALDLAAVGRLALVEVFLAVVAGLCLLIGSAWLHLDTPTGAVWLGIAAAGAVTTLLIGTVPLPNLQVGPEPIQADPTFVTPVLECLCGPGVLFGGALVFARRWLTNRRKAEAAAQDAVTSPPR
jgi:hypothetical protein